MWDLWCTKWQWHRFFSEYYNFLPSVALHQCFIHINLPEGQTGKAWDASKKALLFQTSERMRQKSTFTCFVFKVLMFTLLDTRQEEERLKAWWQRTLPHLHIRVVHTAIFSSDWLSEAIPNKQLHFNSENVYY